MTVANAVGSIIGGGIFVIIALGAWGEYTDAKAAYDLLCGGFIEFISEAFGDRSCDETKTYMNVMLVVSILSGLGGIGMVGSGLIAFGNQSQSNFTPIQQQPQLYYQQQPQMHQQQPQMYQQQVMNSYLHTPGQANNFQSGDAGIFSNIESYQQQKNIDGLQQSNLTNMNENYGKKNNGFALFLFAIGIVIILSLAFVFIANDNMKLDEDINSSQSDDFDNDGIINSEDLDDDNDGILDSADWYDYGNGGIMVRFSYFRIWESGSYDSSNGLPDVYAYVGFGNEDCGDMEYFPYLNTIHENAHTLNNWQTYEIDFEDDEKSVCVEVTIYDEDSFDLDDILDFVPGQGNYYQHKFNLATGEGDFIINKDNRGENSNSIQLSYELSRVNLD